MWGDDKAGCGGWGNDKAVSGGWSEDKAGSGGWGDDKAGSGGWGNDKAESGGWGDDKDGKGGCGDDNAGSGGWGDNKASSGGWGNDKGGSEGCGDDTSKRKRFKSDGDSGSTSRKPGGEGEGEERPAPYKPEELDLEEEAKLNSEGVGENFHRYRDQVVTCLPLNLINPIDKFEDAIESNLLLSNCKKLGYTEMTPIQKWAIPAIMAGHDIIGCAQTGSGKTAAFLLPVIQRILKSDLDTHDPNSDCQNPYCLVISPTRELARQLHTHAEIISNDSVVKCRYIYGQVQTSHLKAKLSTGCHILIATPGRLNDFLERGWVSFKNIKYVILDEGDRLVDDSFAKDVRGYFNHESMPPKDQRQTLFFSATFKQEVQRNAKEFLKDSFVFVTVGKVGAANEDIKQEFIQVKRENKKRELKKILLGLPEEGKTIIFTQTKAIADILAVFFTQLGLSSTSIHGDRHQSQREQAISSFRKGQKRFLISSPVGNRGLDLPKVALVINYDLPNNIDEYVHRIGRTARAGRTGKAISFYDESHDREILPDLLRMLEDAKQEIPDWLRQSAGIGGVSSDTGGFALVESAGGGGDEDWGSSSAAAPATTATSDTENWGASINIDPKTSSGEANPGEDWGSTSEITKPENESEDKVKTEGDDWASGW